MVVVQESKSKVRHDVGLRFTITQHTRDSVLLDSFLEYLDCGKCYFSRNEVTYIVSTFSNINNKIIPLFDYYPIQGIKALDYLEFKKVANLMHNKEHLTEQGLFKIQSIKFKMNLSRKL